MYKLLYSIITICFISVLCPSPASAKIKDTSGMKIAMSNFYAGNTWRQSLIKAWDDAAGKAVKDGIIKATKVVNANNSATEQASQIESLIVEGWNAIAVDPISSTAINGAIQDACDAGIVVVVFNETSTASCATHVIVNYKSYGEQEAKYLVKTLKGKGVHNILEIRGIAGTSADKDIHDGIVGVFSKHPNFKIVASVNGNWTQTIAQRQVSSVLPSLPKIAAVVTQGGDGFGAYQAFKAAGRPIPVIIMGNRQVELKAWKNILKSDPNYKTFSISSTPGVSAATFWVAQEILAGRKVPNRIEIPLPAIRKADLNKWLKVLPKNSVVTVPYTQAWVRKWIENANVGKPAPKPPIVKK